MGPGVKTESQRSEKKVDMALGGWGWFALRARFGLVAALVSVQLEGTSRCVIVGGFVGDRDAIRLGSVRVQGASLGAERGVASRAGGWFAG